MGRDVIGSHTRILVQMPRILRRNQVTTLAPISSQIILWWFQRPSDLRLSTVTLPFSSWSTIVQLLWAIMLFKSVSSHHVLLSLSELRSRVCVERRWWQGRRTSKKPTTINPSLFFSILVHPSLRRICCGSSTVSVWKTRRTRAFAPPRTCWFGCFSLVCVDRKCRKYQSDRTVRIV